MDIYERFRYLRKDKLKLSQTEFGLRVGVTIGVIKNIEQKKVKPKELFIQQVCKEYHVNYAWITQEQGEIFDNNENVIIDEFAKNITLTKQILILSKIIYNLNPTKEKYSKNTLKTF